MTAKCTYVFNVCIFISFIINLRFGSSQVISIERENVELLFRYNSTNDVNFQLQYEDNPAFYKDDHFNYSHFKPDQQSRFKVLETISNENWSSLYLTILNVSRYDAGIYRCLVSNVKSSVYVILNEVDLIVDYAPGKAHCDLLPSNETFHFDVIECTAEAGNIQGYIICIQNSELAMPKTDLFRNPTILYQQIFVVKKEPLCCCTRTERNVNDISNCNDFTLNLQTTTTPVHNITTPKDINGVYYDMVYVLTLTFFILFFVASLVLIAYLMSRYKTCKCSEKYVRFSCGWKPVDEEDTAAFVDMDELPPEL